MDFRQGLSRLFGSEWIRPFGLSFGILLILAANCRSSYGPLVFAGVLGTSHDHHARSFRSNRGSHLLSHLDSDYYGMDRLPGSLQETVQEAKQRRLFND